MPSELESKPRSQVYPARILTEQLEAMKAIKRATGATVAEQIRRGISLWLKKQGKSLL